METRLSPFCSFIKIGGNMNYFKEDLASKANAHYEDIKIRLKDEIKETIEKSKICGNEVRRASKHPLHPHMYFIILKREILNKCPKPMNHQTLVSLGSWQKFLMLLF